MPAWYPAKRENLQARHQSVMSGDISIQSHDREIGQVMKAPNDIMMQHNGRVEMSIDSVCTLRCSPIIHPVHRQMYPSPVHQEKQ